MPVEMPGDNVFVTSMPAGLTDQDVTSLFNNYGSVSSVRITSKPEHTFTSALIRFATPAEAKYVVENLNGNLAPGLSDPLEVRYANAPGAGKGGGGKGGPPPGAAGWGGGGGDWGGKGGAGDWGGSWAGGAGSKGHLNVVGFGPAKGGKGDAGFSPYGMGMGMDMMAMMKGGKGGGKGVNDAESMCAALESSGHLPGAGIPKNQIIEVFVFGLPPDTTDAHLYRIFATFGQISPKGCSAQADKATGLCKGYGFVNYLSGESAQLAIQSLNGFQLPGGRALRVELKGEKRAAAGGKGGDMASPEAMALGLM